MIYFIYACLFSFLPWITHGDELLIGAFNIQVFGQSKMDETEVVKTLVKVSRHNFSCEVIIILKLFNVQQLRTNYRSEPIK